MKLPIQSDPVVRSSPNVADPTLFESAPDLLKYCGSDASRWAEQFNAHAVRLGHAPMDQGWLVGWFANAIMRSLDEDRWRRERRDTAVPPLPGRMLQAHAERYLAGESVDIREIHNVMAVFVGILSICKLSAHPGVNGGAHDLACKILRLAGDERFI